MDFIEKYLGFLPDDGGGQVEAMLLLVLLTIITGTAMAFFRKLDVRN